MAKLTIWSAPEKLNWPWLGSVASHFIAFSAVTWLNSVPAMVRYWLSFASGVVASAAPMNLPRLAACVRSGAEASAGVVGSRNTVSSAATAVRDLKTNTGAQPPIPKVSIHRDVIEQQI